ncbi:MAG: Glutathione transporter permease [Firmicutes bacterium]|nr:Glutathione transporter permease [Bacillota bacterium]
MLKYILRRLAGAIPVFLGVSVLVFLMVHMIPGDPVRYLLGEFATPEAEATLRAQMGLNDPLPLQYLHYLSRVITGDLGTSLITRVSVSAELTNRVPLTLTLAALSMLIGLVGGMLAGVIAAIRQNTVLDYGVMSLALIGISAPSFWIALVLMYVFAFRLSLFPVSGYSGIHSLILPACTLGALTAGSIARMTRSSLLEVLRQDFVRTARAKGLPQRLVVFKHALKNALLPVTTLVGLQFGGLLGGSVITETVFALPGVGSYAIQAIGQRDFPVIQSVVLFSAVVFVCANLAVDLLYGYLDPKIRYQ